MNSKAEFSWVFKLIQKREDFLAGKDEELGELFRLCDNDVQRNLVSSLLERFFFLDGKRYGSLLAAMARYIKSLGYPIDKCVVMAMSLDDQPDSSQEVLQNLKVYLAIEFDVSINFCTSMSDLQGWYNKGFRHFIIVDEFIGSGRTVKSRYRRFSKLKTKEETTIDFCILSGMRDAVNQLTSVGIPIKVMNILSKGISDFYFGEAYAENITSMLDLESKLAENINTLRRKDFSLGFLSSESIYYKENGNVPNNVFPIFWWKRYLNNSKRLTLFTRVQHGY